MREVSQDPAVLDVVDHHADEVQRRRNRIIDAIDRLPVEIRDVLNARFWERLSKQQTAAALGIHRITVERRVAEGKRLLREELESDPEFYEITALLQED